LKGKFPQILALPRSLDDGKMMANGKLQKQALLPPRSPFPTAAPYADHGLIARPQGASRHRHTNGHGHHQRTSSESFIEEQPSWLDDLLNEPDTPVTQHGRAGHRRSSSDTFALFDGGSAGAVACASGFAATAGGGVKAAPWGGVQEHYAKPGSIGRLQGRPWEQGMSNLGGYRHGGGPLMLPKDKPGGHHGPPSALRNHDRGMDNRAPDDAGHDQKIGLKEGVPPKHAQSEADTKCAKQWVWLLFYYSSHIQELSLYSRILHLHITIMKIESCYLFIASTLLKWLPAKLDRLLQHLTWIHVTNCIFRMLWMSFCRSMENETIQQMWYVAT
jgi:hypothetical protein